MIAICIDLVDSLQQELACLICPNAGSATCLRCDRDSRRA
jgi:hypothetical protein